MRFDHQSTTAKRWLRRSLIWGLLAIAVVFVLVRCSHRDAAAEKRRGDFGRPIAVVAAKATRGDLPIYLDALGTVTPTASVLVRSRVDGELVNVRFREGQLVKAGDLLAEIDPRAFRVQLQQAQGQLARDEALLRNARSDLERYETLWKQDSIAKQELDTQEALVRQYEGTLESDRAAIADAKLQLDYAQVRAPISGRVGLRQVDSGNIVHASDATGIVLITQEQPITVVFTIPEVQLGAVRKQLLAGQTLTAEAWDRQRSAKLAEGKLLTVDNQIDTTTGTVKLKAEFENKDGALFPNQFVNVRMHVSTIRDAVLIPANAVQRGSQGTFVYTVNGDDTVKLQLLDVGQMSGEQIVVTRGLAADARVVVDGVDKLRDGGKIEVIDPNKRIDAGAAESNAEPSGEKRRGEAHGKANAT
jgi:multidrug efflux system membrane fusion protein